MKYNLNNNWEFTTTDNEAFRLGKTAEEAGVTIEEVRLPHTVAVTPYDYFDESIYQMISGYRRILDVPDSWRGKTVLLHIGAAAHSAEVYVNGRLTARHQCGYTAFTADLTDALTWGAENVLAIRVDSRENQNIPPFGHVIDYMTYGGLYREVSLEVKEPAYIRDVYAIPRISTRARLLDKDCQEENVRESLEALSVRGTVWSELTLRLPERIDGEQRGHEEFPSEEQKEISIELTGEESEQKEISIELTGEESEQNEVKSLSDEIGQKDHKNIVDKINIIIRQSIWEKKYTDIYINNNTFSSKKSHLDEPDSTSVKGESDSDAVYQSNKNSDIDVSGNKLILEKEFHINSLKTRIRKTPEGDTRVYVTKLSVPQCRVWDIEKPDLYKLKTELVVDGKCMDVSEEVFGFRRTHFTADGFYLNGRKLKIRGLNRHQSYPYVGYAMPKSMQAMDADILKNELGLNAVRTSHYPQSRHFVDRCDQIGLLVFTEIPGWQHIGDEVWKLQAIRNTQDMVMQYRNHPSIILWGVRINESADDDTFYRSTNAAARALDSSRATGGVRCHKKSSLLEDVYTFNDFVHSGKNEGCQKKKKVTSDMDKAYLVTEYNGHMFPTKMYDSEDHRLEHALRHANVLDAVAGEEDIAGSFGWCMADYNTHQDFGSGDRICYHGVLDMYRNHKPAAAVYSAQSPDRPVLAISSAMDIGEHPEGNPSEVWIFTNADQVLMYKNEHFLKEYKPEESPYHNLAHPPMPVDEYIGRAMIEKENFTPAQEKEVRQLLNYAARYGFNDLPSQMKARAAHLMARYGMTFIEASDLYGKYVGDWGGTATSYRFEAIRDGQLAETVIKSPVTSIHMHVEVSHTHLMEEETYDVAAIRIRMQDQNGNDLPFYQCWVRAEVENASDPVLEIIGPDIITLRGGCGGTYVKTTGRAGTAILRLTNDQAEEVKIRFVVEV